MLKNLRRLFKIACLHAPFPIKPEQIQIDITDRCNYRCPTCSKWRDRSMQGELTTQQWETFLFQAKSLPLLGRIVFAGGEPLLRPDITELVHYTNSLKLNSVLITNASLLTKTKLCELQDAGLDYLMVSLNALDPGIHDETRGVKGSFTHIMQVLDMYETLRDTMKLGIVTIIMKNNLHQLLHLVDFVSERHLHGIIFQAYLDDMIHHPFHWEHGSFRDAGWYKTNSYMINDYEQLDRTLDAVLFQQSRGKPMLNAPLQIKAMKTYYRNPAQYCKIRCTAGITNFLVDAYGNARVCFGLESIGNICTQDPWMLWKSPQASRIRKQVAQCRHSCRIMNHIY